MCVLIAFMLTDFKDKIHVMREQKNTQTDILELNSWNAHLHKSAYEDELRKECEICNFFFQFLVKAPSNVDYSDSFVVTCSKIIDLIFIIELIIHQKLLEFLIIGSRRKLCWLLSPFRQMGLVLGKFTTSRSQTRSSKKKKR